MDEAELQGWVTTATGCRIERFFRVGSGASRATWIVDLEGADRVVLRVDSGDGPLSGTALDLRREACVYRALGDTTVRIPRLLAAHDDGSALLIEYAVGTDAFALAPDDAKPALAVDYMRALGELHNLDADSIDVDALGRPESLADAPVPDLDLWLRIADRRAPGDELINFAGDWLCANAPESAERVSVCHGDAGAGNFLFEGSRVTALLDWEFAHLGDPVDDLAWVSVRAHLLGGFGDWKADIEAWRSTTGLGVDATRLEYYRALVLVRMAISCLAALSFVGERTMNANVYHMLLPYLRWLIPQALARAGCGEPQCAELERAGAAEVEQSPVLSTHAKPLDLLELP